MGARPVEVLAKHGRKPVDFYKMSGEKSTYIRNYTVSVVIVTWNSKNYIQAGIKALIKSSSFSGVPYEIIVVDNNSSDGTPKLIKDRFPQVKLIANATNRGFGAGNNQGAEASQGTHILFLNPDAIVLLSAVERM